jgi:hypothetical protein
MKMKISISRKINTAAYENIVISVDIERECTSSNEISFKSELLDEVISSYTMAQERVLEELGLGEKVAHQEKSSSASSGKDLPRRKLTDKDLEGII